MKGMLKLGIVLALYATAACVGLAFVYSATSEIIAVRQQADLEAALQELFPEGEVFTDITGAIESLNPTVAFESQYAVQKGTGFIGAVIQASAASYGGTLTVLVGVGADGTISRVKIMEHQDTPGLGANAASPTYYVNKPEKITFYGQFAGKSVQDPFEVQGDVVAITASTITSKAVTLAVKASGDAALAWFATQKGGAQ
ncbi:MAG: FMN-binding protein [Treponema sp.]|jgi:electron transport complex protein RnfG|nr:FMN-binding protein [Treponema sp.]